MSRQLLLVTAVIALAALLAGPGVAAAGTASTRTITFEKRDTGSGNATIVGLRYEAGRGERNGLRVEVDPRGATLTDRVRIRAGRGCRRVPGRGPRTVRCSFRGAQGLDGGPDTDGADEVRARVRLHDGRDRAVVTGDFPGDVPGSYNEGTPSFMTMEGGRGSDRMRAGADFGLFIGGPGNDRMSGGDGADRFHEGRRRNGADTISGGSNPPFVTPDDGDRVTYGKRRQRVVADLAGDRDDGAPGERDMIASNVESIYGGRGNDVISGNTKKNGLVGGGGRDTLNGGAGDDGLVAGRGRTRDVLNGGPGDDVLSGNAGANRLNPGPGADTLETSGGADIVGAHDGFLDKFDCGSGRERLRLDRLDFITRDCGGVTRRGLAAAVPLGFAVFNTGELPYAEIGCPADASRRCVGTVTTLYRGRVLSRKRFNIGRGRVGDINVIAGRRALEGKTVRLRVRSRVNRRVTRTVTAPALVTPE